MKNRYYFISFLFFVVFVFISLFAWKNFSNYETTDNAYVRGSITTISSRIEGYVNLVPGLLNAKVNKGDVLVEFDDAPFIAKVRTAEANLKAATAKLSEIDFMQYAEKLKIDEQKLQLKLAENKIMSANAKKDSERSNFIMYKNEKNRIEKLLETKNVTKSNYDLSFLSNLNIFNLCFFKISNYPNFFSGNNRH